MNTPKIKELSASEIDELVHKLSVKLNIFRFERTVLIERKEDHLDNVFDIFEKTEEKIERDSFIKKYNETAGEENKKLKEIENNMGCIEVALKELKEASRELTLKAKKEHAFSLI